MKDLTPILTAGAAALGCEPTIDSVARAMVEDTVAQERDPDHKPLRKALLGHPDMRFLFYNRDFVDACARYAASILPPLVSTEHDDREPPSLDEWRDAVAAGDTELGYWDWCEEQEA